MSATDLCAYCGGDCGMSGCPQCHGCENTGEQPCPACQPDDEYDYGDDDYGW